MQNPKQELYGTKQEAQPEQRKQWVSYKTQLEKNYKSLEKKTYSFV